MPRVLDPFRFVLIAVAGWMNQRQLQVIDYLREENRVLRACHEYQSAFRQNGRTHNMPNVKETGEQPKRRAATAESMAAKQRDISVSEFFAKNRHLLGFDNPRKALLTAVKEAVDNSLDACEEAG